VTGDLQQKVAHGMTDMQPIVARYSLLAELDSALIDPTTDDLADRRDRSFLPTWDSIGRTGGMQRAN
jgi:hypothetical protein